MSENRSSGGVGLIELSVLLFTLLFVGLKLSGIGIVASWSWGWVLAPLWLSALTMLVFIAVVLVVAGLKWLAEK